MHREGLKKHQGQAHTQFTLFSIHFSCGQGRVVRGQNHGPSVDVEKCAARAWRALTVAYAPRIARVLAAVHAPGNGAVVPENVRKGNNVKHGLRGWQVQQRGSNLGSARPPSFCLSRAIIVQVLNECTLALLDATSVRANAHLENHIDASIPALIDGRAERCK